MVKSDLSYVDRIELCQEPWKNAFTHHTYRVRSQCCSDTGQLWPASVQHWPNTVGIVSAECPAGKYWRVPNEECVVCPKGTYNPDKDAERCLPCEPGTVTEHPGATSPSQCDVTGTLNLCDVNLDDCPRDMADCSMDGFDFVCTCKLGWEGDGYNCKGKYHFRSNKYHWPFWSK